MAKNLFGELLGWIKAIIFSIVFFLVVSIFVFQPYNVNGSSMEPTLHGMEPGVDRVGVYKSAYKFWGSPKYGEIVIIDSRLTEDRTLKKEILENPLINLITKENEDNQSKWVKRVVGLAGDTIEVKDGKLYRNDKVVEENYIKEPIHNPFAKVVVPENHVFVMGDNRNNSSDSRVIGAVPLDHVIGKVFVRFYPFDKMGTF